MKIVRVSKFAIYLNTLKKRIYRCSRVSRQDNLHSFLDDFDNLCKENNIVVIKRYIKFITDSIQAEFNINCSYNDKTTSIIDNVYHSFILSENIDNNRTCKYVVDVKDTPIIACIWNDGRMINNIHKIGHINNNPFDGEKNCGNIIATIFKPLGLVIVVNGNHSTNAAIIHREGKLIINHEFKMSSLLQEVYFDGKYYINKVTKKKVKDKILLDNSKPYTYSIGVLFEMAKVLEKYHLDLSTYTKSLWD